MKNKKDYSEFLESPSWTRNAGENPTASLEEIEKFQKEMNIIFPEDYKQFLQKYNGVQVKYGFSTILLKDYFYMNLDDFV